MRILAVAVLPLAEVWGMHDLGAAEGVRVIVPANFYDSGEISYAAHLIAEMPDATVVQVESSDAACRARVSKQLHAAIERVVHAASTEALPARDAWNLTADEVKAWERRAR